MKDDYNEGGYLFDISLELNGVSLMLLALNNQIDNSSCDCLTEESLKGAIMGIHWHLNRIAGEIAEMDELCSLKKKSMAEAGDNARQRIEAEK